MYHMYIIEYMIYMWYVHIFIYMQAVAIKENMNNYDFTKGKHTCRERERGQSLLGIAG